MDRRLQDMLDHYEITQLMADYVHACDRCDAVSMADVYAEDSWDQHGTLNAPGKEFAHEITKRGMESTTTLSHTLGQTLVKVDGDTAGAETYFIVVMNTPQENGGEICHQMGGRYVDKLERIDGRWLIKHRVVVRDWSVSIPVEHNWYAGSGMAEGQRSNADASYAVLGRTHIGFGAPR
jgi:ketosteroid isomerase-like protein